MTQPSSKRRNALRACALLAAIVGTPAACTLNLAGKQTGGAESTSTSTTATGSTSSAGGGGASTTTTTSGSSGTGGAPTFCEPNEVQSCYDGAAATRNQGACKDGTHTCLATGTAFGACMNQTLPSPENCLEPGDEDCDNVALGCTGATLKGGSLGAMPADEVIFAVATDLAGDLFVGGVTGAVPPAGQGFFMQTGAGGIVQIKPDGTMGWSTPMMNGVASYSVVRGLTTDKQGDVYVVGEFQGTTSLGTFNLVGAGGVDVFLAKLDPNGKALWAESFGNGADQNGYAIAIDTTGNVFITGRAVGTVDFGGGPPGVSAGASDNIFVAKYDPLGKHLWSREIGDGAIQAGRSVATTPEGDVVVAGELGGTVDFGGGISLKSAGGADVFVAKLAGGTGLTLWANGYGDGQDQLANGVAVGSDGGIVITGYFDGHCNFGGMNFDAHASTDVFIAKLHPDGTPDWSHDYGSDNELQVGVSVAVDPALNIVAVGYFKGTLAFGSTMLSDVSTGQDTDVFVAKLSAAGAPVWAYRFGDTKDEAAWAVTTDAKSNVFMGGTYNDTLNLPPSITTMGGYDGFWAKLAP